MNISRVLQYAEMQARIRARIGNMPDAAQWRHVADSRDLDTLIARMRENRLGYWVSDLPRTPDTTAIENHLQKRMMDLFAELERLLPGHRQAVRQWLRTGSGLVDQDRPALWTVWWDSLPEVLQSLPRHDRAQIGRVHSLVERHLHKIRSAPGAADMDRQWLWRNELATALHKTLGSEPFHLGMVMVYAVLRALQFERCRALLVSLAHGWEPPDLLRGAA